MGNLTLNGATSGQLTLAPPAVAGTNTLTLPAQTATVLTDSSGVLNIGSGQVYKDTSGNVGIGTSSPSARLQVANSSGDALLTVGATYPLTFYSNNGSVDAAIYNKASTGAIRFGTSTDGITSSGFSEKMRIDSSGNLLVGTTSAQGKFTVVPGTSQYSFASNAPNSSGTYYHAIFLANGVTNGAISSNGTTTSYVTSSDYRLKENVTPMTTSLARIGALKPVTYEWISDKSKGEGFIAHELQTVIPAAVTGDKDAVDAEGNPVHQGVDYSKIVVHLVAAVQELKAYNDALKARITALEAK